MANKKYDIIVSLDFKQILEAIQGLAYNQIYRSLTIRLSLYDKHVDFQELSEAYNRTLNICRDEMSSSQDREKAYQEGLQIKRKLKKLLKVLL